MVAVEFQGFEKVEALFEAKWPAFSRKGKTIPRERIIAFEDPEDMARLITTAKLALFREVRRRAGSITELAERLHRDRSAVKRDIDELEKAGLIEVQDMPLPEHGRQKEVRAVAEQLLLAI